MIVSNPPGPVSLNQAYLLAVARNVDANTLATTALSWQNGMSAATTFPMYARITRKTGTLSLMVASLRLNSVIVQPISAVQSALLGAASDPLLYPLSSAISVTIVPITGNWDIVIGTINGSGATLDCEIWGLVISR